MHLQNWFRDHPILFPLGLLVGGMCLLSWGLFQADVHHLAFFYLIGLAGIATAVGACLLPVGIVVSMRRQSHPVVLRCPWCEAQSHTCSVPFRIEHPPHVEYIYIVCSRCGGDFTMSKYVRLV